MEDEANEMIESASKPTDKGKRVYVRSKYLFPVYDMEISLEIARVVDTQGAGSLSEASLAMALGLSAKSSGFALRVASAKQFGLVERRGESFYTTHLARGIFRFINETERENNLVQAFYKIELFRAIGDRFEGVPLPSDDLLRNLLERELGIKRARVGDAFNVFLKSAKLAGVLRESQGKTYLIRQLDRLVEPVVSQQGKVGEQELIPPTPSIQKQPVTATWNVSVDTKDFASMDAEAIKAAMDGLERLAKIIVSKQESEEEINTGREEDTT